MKRRWIYIWICSVIGGLAIVWSCREERYEIANVEPEIAGLQRPFSRVTAGYFLDGGSIGMEIIDANGKKLKLALPVGGEGTKQEYSRLVIGVEHIAELKKTNAPPVKEIELNEDTRRFLTVVLRREAQSDVDRDAALMALGGRMKDTAWILCKALAGRAIGR
jgi:hypothetical protein